MTTLTPLLLQEIPDLTPQLLPGRNRDKIAWVNSLWKAVIASNVISGFLLKKVRASETV
jgi:hypothetical protein